MTYARIPDLSQPLTPFHADPILAAIEAHDTAWTAWQVAAGPRQAEALAELGAALGRLLTTPCATEFGSIALLRHLRWHIEQDEITDVPVLVCAAGLAAHLQVDFPPGDMPRSQVAPVLRALTAAARRHTRHDGPAFAEFPAEMMPGSIEPWEAVALVRPDTAHVRAPRLLDHLGEALAAIALVAGGMVLVGFATLA